jgi:DNA-binding NtrC family response regulator
MARDRDASEGRPGRGSNPANPSSSDRLWLEVELLASTGTPDTPHREARGGATVMIIAHDADMRTYIRDCLAMPWLRTVEAADLVAAEALIEGGAPELLVLDVGSGAATDPTLAEVEAIPGLAGLPRVLITDEVLDPEQARTTPTGARAVVMKPFNARRLRDDVVRCLGRPIHDEPRGDAP